MPLKSLEYEEFMREEKLIKKLTWYENLCGFSEKILPIDPWKSLEDEYNKSANFSHLKITSRGAFATAILSTLLVFLVPTIISIVFNFFSASTLLLPLIFSALTFFYFYYYPTRYATLFRIKASAEMMLATIYITIAMRMSPNIEGAVRFAAMNLSGPLAYDLRQLLWDVYTRKYDSMSDALDSFVSKWKKDNQEFAEALTMIKGAVFESKTKLEETLDEAIEILLSGTKERMKHYAQEMQTPVTVLNAMGILLPIIGLVFFPIISIFMPEVMKPSILVIGYDILLPLGVYWLLEIYLERRPYTFHQPDVSKHPKFLKQKFFDRIFFVSVIIAIAATLVFGYQFLLSTERFSPELLMYSIMLTWGVVGSIIFFSIVSSYSKIQLRDEIVGIENEFAEAMFQLGNQLTRGIPLESAIRNTVPRIRDLKIVKFLEIVLYNIETFGMTFEQAVFDPKNGAINQYPSKTIEAVMRAVVEISRKGMSYVASSLVSISTYLKDMHTVEEDLREMMSETTSTMSLQAILLAPLTCGVVVGLTALITQILISLEGAISKLFGPLEAAGPLGSAGGSLVSSIVNIEALIPVHYFQIIVSVYMIEVVSIIAVGLSVIANGEENLLKRYTLGKLLLISTILYTIVLAGMYSMFTTLIPLTKMIGA